MRFTAPAGKQVMFKGRIISAKNGAFDTDDAELISVLKNATDVDAEEVKRGRPKKAESPE